MNSYKNSIILSSVATFSLRILKPCDLLGVISEAWFFWVSDSEEWNVKDQKPQTRFLN